MQTGKSLTFTDASAANRKLENLSVIGKHTDDAHLWVNTPVHITGALNVSTINTPGPLLLQTSDTTRLNIDASGNASFSGSLTIQGDVSIQGTTTTVNATQVDIGDNIILLNAGATGLPSLNAGFEIERGSEPNVSFLWDETNDRWSAGANDIQASEFYENGTALSSKYLGIGAKAADSEMLDGLNSTDFLLSTATATNSSGLDGLTSAQFLRSDTNDSYAGGILRIENTAGDKFNVAAGGLQSLEIFQSTAEADAFMTFHVGSDYAFYFGLDGTTNDLAIGGWSMGADKHRVWHAGNDGSGSGLDADLLDGNDSSYFAVAADTYTKSEVDDAVAGATITGLVRSTVGSDVIWTFS